MGVVVRPDMTPRDVCIAPLSDYWRVYAGECRSVHILLFLGTEETMTRLEPIRSDVSQLRQHESVFVSDYERFAPVPLMV